jgi:hypothetical protein
MYRPSGGFNTGTAWGWNKGWYTYTFKIFLYEKQLNVNRG